MAPVDRPLRQPALARVVPAVARLTVSIASHLPGTPRSRCRAADGSTVHVRPVRPSDQPDLLRFLESLSRDSVGLRFFSAGVNLRAGGGLGRASRLSEPVRPRGTDRRGPPNRGHAVYERTGTDRAEVAFEVADALQGRGLARSCSRTWPRRPRSRVSPCSRQGAAREPPDDRSVPRKRVRRPRCARSRTSWWSKTQHRSPPDAIERFEERERNAAAAGDLDHFLRPAFRGCDRRRAERRGTVGGEIFHNLLSHAFNGPVHPVNPSADVVQSVPAFTSVVQVAGEVELAVICVPAPSVVDTARQCAQKGVRALARDLGRIRRNRQ